MSKTNLKKLQGLTQKIQALKAEQETLQKALLDDFVKVVERSNALHVDFHALVGAFLETIENVKGDPKKVWQDAGRKFCQTELGERKRKSSTAKTHDEKAA